VVIRPGGSGTNSRSHCLTSPTGTRYVPSPSGCANALPEGTEGQRWNVRHVDDPQPAIHKEGEPEQHAGAVITSVTTMHCGLTTTRNVTLVPNDPQAVRGLGPRKVIALLVSLQVS